MNRELDIKARVQERGIRALYHFTSRRNLRPIAEHGLVSRAWLEGSDVRPDLNDQRRLDGFVDWISISIQHPNSWLLSHHDKRLSYRTYAILELRPNLLWQLDCLFSPSNMAAYGANRWDEEDLRGPYAFENMFLKKVRSRVRDHSVAPRYPTDEQAEVLVRRHVAVRFIERVHFVCERDLRTHLERNPEFTIESKVSPELFRSRESLVE